MSLVAANHYDLTGVVSGTVDTAAVGGKPEISVIFDGQRVQEAELEQTPSGFQVAALIDARPDLDTRLLIVLLPDVNVSGAPVPVAAIAAVVTVRTSIGGPRLVEAPPQSYAIHPVSVLASAVQSLS